MRSLAALLLVLVLAGCGAAPESPPSPNPTSTASAGWRTESWHGVELQVPDRWAIGYAPMPQRDDTVLSCGVGPESVGGRDTAAAYVGRPMYGSDACQKERPDEVKVPPNAVWFGSPLPVGQRDGGRTVAVGSTRVTVAVQDAATRDRILDSVRTVEVDAHGCPSRKVVNRGWPTEGFRAVRRFAVCVYDGRDLVWSQLRGAADGERFVHAFDHGRPLPRWPRLAPARQSVVLRISADDPMGDQDLVIDYEVRFDPARIGAGDGRTVQMTPATVRPWASAGLRLYCVGPVPDAVAAYFRPVLG